MIEGSDSFRPDLEGLRAVAVVLVVLYHAGVPGFRGGYVGVDVFFVLSGFFITGLLLRETQRTGTISLSSFYARRARRLLPAAAFVLLVTVGVTWLVLPPLQVESVAGDAAATSLYVSNIWFAVQATDYLQAELAPSPLLHYWSLGVEEQFYLFWPVVVLLVVGLSHVVSARRIALAAGAIAIASFGLSLWWTEANAPWAFFSLPTRAWELGLGALMAIGAVRLLAIPRAAASAIAWIGLGLVGLSGLVLSTETSFPGIAALMPTVGCALVIAGGSNRDRMAPGRWLSTAGPRFLGRISYSLYLWHWPLLVLPAAMIAGDLPWWSRCALVALAIALAAGTQRWVEEPLRHGRWIGSRPQQNLALAGSMAMVLVAVSIGVGASATNGLQGSGQESDLAADEAQLERVLDETAARRLRLSGSDSLGPSGALTLSPTSGGSVPTALRPSLASARDDKAMPYSDGCAANHSAVVSGGCTYANPSSEVTVVLMGDSHALSWFPALYRLSQEQGWRLISLTKANCQPADITLWEISLKRRYHECEAWRTAMLERVEREHPALVVVSSSRSFTLSDVDGRRVEGTEGRMAAWIDGSVRTLRRLTRAAGGVAIIADTPASIFDVPVCLSAHLDDLLACATPVERTVNPQWIEATRRAAEVSGAAFVDPTLWVCPSTPCPPVLGNFILYRDTSHLTATFSASLSQRLGAVLPIVGRP